MTDRILLSAILLGWLSYIVAFAHANSRTDPRAPKWEMLMGLGGAAVGILATVAGLLRLIWS